MIWNAVDPKPVESAVVYPFKGLALCVRATIDIKTEKKRAYISLRIVEPTRLDSNWSLNVRYDAKSSGRYDDPHSKQFYIFSIYLTF